VESLQALRDCPSFDVVFNLAGAPLAEQRWSEARKDTLLQSRLRLTTDLVSLLAHHHNRDEAAPGSDTPPVPVLVSASAVGVYGVTATPTPQPACESSDPVETQSFSHTLCAQWEAAATTAERESRARVVLARLGVVLGRDDGALARMLLPFEFGLGGTLGCGSQAFPWIHIHDAVQALLFCAACPSVAGPVNVVAPEQGVTNATLTSTLGEALRRPACLPVPAPVLRWLLGRQMANELLLAGRHVTPRVLLSDAHVVAAAWRGAPAAPTRTPGPAPAPAASASARKAGGMGTAVDGAEVTSFRFAFPTLQEALFHIVRPEPKSKPA